VLADARRVLQHVAGTAITRRDHPAGTRIRWHVETHTRAASSSFLEGPPATSGITSSTALQPFTEQHQITSMC